MNRIAASAPHGIAGTGVFASLAELIALRELVGSVAWGAETRFAAAPGGHATSRRTRGMEFAEVRPYQAGDDARTIDWRQTARCGRLYTKLFHEERQRPLRLLVDLGPSMRFGTRVAFKSVIAARTAAVLAWAAVAAGDRVGGLVWNGAVAREFPALGWRHGALKLLKGIADISAAPPSETTTNIAPPLELLLRSRRPGGLTVLISDFATLDSEVEQRIAALARACDLMLVQVYDIFESEPPPQCYRLSDGKRSLDLDLRAPAARAAYGAEFAARRARVEQLARHIGADFFPLATHANPAALLPRVHPHGRGARQILAGVPR